MPRLLVSEFKIGRGEIYVEKYGAVPAFIEIIGVRPMCGGRWIAYAYHDSQTGKKLLDQPELIHFGASSFLAHFRPAAASDFDPRPVPAKPLSRAVRKQST